MSIKGALIARVCPLHVAHEILINRLFEFTNGPEHALIVIGSSNAPISLPVFFSYEERRRFLKTVYPNARVVGLPDYPTDSEWLCALDDIIHDVGGTDPRNVTYFGGCVEDIRFFEEDGRIVEIVNRFDGSTPKISATEVRDALIEHRSLDGLVNPLIQEEVRGVFKKKWEQFKRMR